GVALPVFQVGSAAIAVGIAEAAVQATIEHLTHARFEARDATLLTAPGLAEPAVQATIEHLTHARFEDTNATLAQLPTLRARVAEMRIQTDCARAHLVAVLDSLEDPGPETQLLVLGV